MVVWQALLIGTLVSCVLVGALVALGARLGADELAHGAVPDGRLSKTAAKSVANRECGLGDRR